MLGIMEQPGMVVTAFKYIFFLSVFACLIFLVLVILQMMGVPVFSVSPGDSGIISLPVPSTQQSAFTTVPITSDLSCNFGVVPSTQYTISFDVLVGADFVTTEVPRVILYRAPYPIGLASDSTLADLGELFNSSNIIVYIDPLTNDLFVGAIKTNYEYVISNPVKNVPLRDPFRITLVVSDNFLEIYMGGELVQMMPYGGGIISSPNTSYFFGPPPVVNQSIKVANIQYWNTELSSKVVRMFGQKPINKTPFKL